MPPRGGAWAGGMLRWWCVAVGGRGRGVSKINVNGHLKGSYAAMLSPPPP